MWEPKGYKEPPGDGSASGVKFTWNIAGALVRQIPGGVEHWCAGGHAHEPLSLLFWRFEIWIAIGNLLDNPRFIGAGEIFPKLHAFREESRVQFVDRKSTRLNSSHVKISYAVFCLKKKKNNKIATMYNII